MSNPPDILASLGLEAALPSSACARDQRGCFSDLDGTRVVFATAEAMRGLQHVIEQERAGGWAATMKTCGEMCGRQIATTLDARLAQLGHPNLSTLPLEASLAFLERTFPARGWGRLKIDLTHAADHGLVVAIVDDSFFVEALPEANQQVDAMLAGVLKAFFEYISGQSLACEEIACGRQGAAHCTFVIAPADKLTVALPRIGHDAAEAILALLTR